MYSSLDTEALSLVDAFCREAETLWKSERAAPSALTMVAAQFLSFGYLVQGKDHAVLQYLSEATKIGAQLGLFGVKPNTSDARLDNMTPEKAKATAYSSWGVFNWITYVCTMSSCQEYPYNLRFELTLSGSWAYSITSRVSNILNTPRSLPYQMMTTTMEKQPNKTQETYSRHCRDLWARRFVRFASSGVLCMRWLLCTIALVQRRFQSVYRCTLRRTSFGNSWRGRMACPWTWFGAREIHTTWWYFSKHGRASEQWFTLYFLTKRDLLT